jgi:hypothetical protein
MRVMVRVLVSIGSAAVMGGMGVGCGGDGGGVARDGAMTGAGGTSGDAGADAQVDPELAAFCASVQSMRIRSLERCTGVASAIAAKFVALDACTAFAPAVAAGRMVFNASEAAGCLSALDAMACDAGALPSACDRALHGALTPGSACNLIAEIARFSECEVGTFCVPSPSGGCKGTCVAGALLNQPCQGASQPCVSGETCTLAGTCTVRGSSGSECSIYTTPICEEGLVCSDLFGGTCGRRLGAGATCGGNPTECEFPMQCDRGLALEGTCKVPPKPGAACVVDEFQCAIGLSYCGADSKCHALAGIGEPCTTTDGEGTYCMLGACDTTLATPVCKPVAVGQQCGSSADCAPGSLCQPQLALGYNACTASCL